MKASKDLYHRHRFPPDIIQYAVCLYHSFSLSFRDIEDLLAERGIQTSYETVRRWCIKFGPKYASRLRKRNRGYGDTWYVDEVFVRVDGQQRYLFRAVDQDGDVIDVLVQKKRDARAAKAFFRKLVRRQGETPRILVTDKLRSYPPALRGIMPESIHVTERYSNNRAERSYQSTRQRERQMRRFKSISQAQRFLSIHAAIQNLFKLGRHLLTAKYYRLFRLRAFASWQIATR